MGSSLLRNEMVNIKKMAQKLLDNVGGARVNIEPLACAVASSGTRVGHVVVRPLMSHNAAKFNRASYER